MQRFWSAGGAGIARGMFLYVLGMAVLATLCPFDFQRIPGRGMAWMFLPDDVVLNLLLLFPVGFLFALGAEQRRPLLALLLGLVLSAALESAQLLLPSRHANGVDVLANALGCWGGALCERRMRRWLSTFVSDQLVLELPLTGALYMLLPLLMLLGLGSGDNSRIWLALPLAMFGAMILAALYQQRFRHASRLPVERYAAYCGLGVAAVCAPALLERSLEVITTAAATTTVVWLAIRARVGQVPAQRRFEAATVRRALPWFALYLGGVVAWAWRDRFGGAHEELGGQRQAMRLLESVAALTIHGYLLSELTARARSRASLLIAATAASGVLIGSLLELAHPTSSGVGASLLNLCALGCSAAAGAALHRAQVRLVQALRASGARSFPPGASSSRRPGVG